jgi:N-acetyl-anhydromuramyl-L-alanine amidase AmpD
MPRHRRDCQPEHATTGALSRRSALAMAAAAGAFGVSTGTARAEQPSFETKPRTGTARDLEAVFDEASARFGVPREVLIAVGWNETRLDNHGGTPSIANGYGIMHLADNPTNTSLKRASQLTGTPVELLKTDDTANVLGAAAVLAGTADQLGVSAGARGEVSAWRPVLAAYSGVADPAVAALYTQGTYVAMASGVAAGGVVLAPQAVPEELRTLTGLPAPTPAMQFAPAYSGNYQIAYREDDYPIDYIIIHVTQGSYAGSIGWFQDPDAGVSAHYVARSSDGALTQCVRDKDIAWHAGTRTMNRVSIGIEHEGYISNPSWFTTAMYRSSANLTRALCEQYAIPKTRSRILGHVEVPGATHSDPGENWDWDTYMAYVLNSTPTFPAWSVTIDTTSPQFTASSNWLMSDYNPQKYTSTYRYTTPEPITDTAWYAATIPAAGSYRVECWYPANAGYNDLVPYVIATPSGNEVVYVNQQRLGGQWRSLGTYSLLPGTANVVGVSRWARGVGYVIADAVRITRVG